MSAMARQPVANSLDPNHLRVFLHCCPSFLPQFFAGVATLNFI
jgi:hypothetical protein